VYETIEFGKRLSNEHELEKNANAMANNNVLFDETGNFIIYSSLMGIKGTLGCLLDKSDDFSC
jgi:peptidylprolyl isomerase domain and WD repeat-containing protein 1